MVNETAEKKPVSGFAKFARTFAYVCIGLLVLVVLLISMGGDDDFNEGDTAEATGTSSAEAEIKMEVFFSDLQARVYGTGMLSLDGETGPKEDRARYADLDLESSAETSMYLTLTWKDTPEGMAEVRGATEMVAKIAVQELAKTGKDLSFFTLSVRSQMPEKGLTGKEMIRTWGRAKYDCTIDSVVWVPFGE